MGVETDTVLTSIDGNNKISLLHFVHKKILQKDNNLLLQLMELFLGNEKSHSNLI